MLSPSCNVDLASVIFQVRQSNSGSNICCYVDLCVHGEFIGQLCIEARGFFGDPEVFGRAKLGGALLNTDPGFEKIPSSDLGWSEAIRHWVNGYVRQWNTETAEISGLFIEQKKFPGDDT